MKRLLLSIMYAMATFGIAAQTLDELQEAARENYPVIKQYDLIRQTADASLSSIGKAWLPQLQATAQGTMQSDVAALPDMLQDMMRQQGVGIKGLSKTQYRVGVDVSQLLYDGGTTRSQRSIARQQEAVSTAQADVDLYTVRRRVNELYFSILLVDERIGLNSDLQHVLQSNEEKLSAMFRGGTATASDVNAMKAERLAAEQQATELQSARQSLTRMLSLLCGREIVKLVPVSPSPSMKPSVHDCQRPEMRLFDAQLRLADAQEQQLKSALMPRLSLFATGFYGYPGYDMFHDMLHRSATLNGMVGARLTWNIGQLYTHRADKSRLDAQRSLVSVQREVFLFNNQLEQVQQSEEVSRYEQLLAHDADIVQLRASVRQAAESKLNHGVISVNDLLQEINRENQAKTDRSMHEIEMMKHIYDLKYITNN